MVNTVGIYIAYLIKEKISSLVQPEGKMTILKCIINFVIGVFIFFISVGIADAAIVQGPPTLDGNTNQE